MSVLIKGMEMPKAGNWKTIRIYPDGTCADPNWQGDCKVLPCVAVPLPEKHGRLIDADALFRAMFTASDGTIMRNGNIDGWPFEMRYADIKKYIKNAPTIVPAEGGTDNGN